MTEERISLLLREFAEPIVPQTTRPSKSLRPHYLRFGVLGVVAAAATAVVLLAPRDAAAARLRQVRSAILNAPSMVSTMMVWDVRPESGSPFETVRYRSGMWRLDIEEGLTREAHIIERDGRFYDFAPRFRLVTVKPDQGPLASGELNVLDYAKSMIDLNGIVSNQMVERTHPPVAGRPAYSLVLDRPAEHYRAEIDVDQASSLPIQTKIEAFYGNGRYKGTRSRIVVDYHFGDTIADSEFDPRSFNLPIHKVVEDQARIAEAWRIPRAHCRQVDILDAWSDFRGKLYIAWASPATDDPIIVPTLSTLEGNAYVKHDSGGEIVSTDWPGKRTLCISGFAPLDPGAPTPRRVVLRFEPRHDGIEITRNIPVSTSISVSLDSGPGPDVFHAFEADRANEEDDAQIDVARAKIYQSKGQLKQELDWRWAAYRTAEGGFPREARIFFAAPIADCLRRLGRPSEADQVLAKYGEPPMKTAS